jgi:polar amino acid transport system permease protein
MSGKAISTEHGAGGAATTSLAGDDVTAVPLRHTGRWVAAAALMVLFGGTLASFWRNPNIDHTVVANYLFDTRILSGVALTVTLTATSMILATMLAVVLAVMRLSTNPVLRVLSWVYIWFFRGTPLLVQVVFWGYLGLLYARLSIGIPFTSITFAPARSSPRSSRGCWHWG